MDDTMRGPSPALGYRPLVFVLSLAAGGSLAAAQTPASAPAPASTPVARTAPAAPASRSEISDLLQPALANLSRNLNGAQLDHWKLNGAMREETARNIDSVRRDVSGTLPGLLQTADSAPASVSAVLPVFRNVDALYDVVLRVTETARMAAPKPQADGLDDARSRLVEARRSLGDHLQSSAIAADQRVRDLQTALNAHAPDAAAAPVCPPVQPTKKKKR